MKAINYISRRRVIGYSNPTNYAGTEEWIRRFDQLVIAHQERAVGISKELFNAWKSNSICRVITIPT